MSQIHPNLTTPSASSLSTSAQELLFYSFTLGADTSAYPLTSDRKVINHNIKPHPLYGLAVLQSAARATLPFYKLGTPVNERDNIPSKLYGGQQMLNGSVDPYRFVDVFEAAQLNVYSYPGGSYQLQGGFQKKDNSFPKNFVNMTYTASPYNFTGVADTGIGAHFQNGVFAFSYAQDKWQFNRYQDNNSPLASLIAAQASIVNSTLYLPPSYNSGTSTWSYSALGSSTSGLDGGLLEVYASPPTVVGTINDRINTHFFINSMGAFEHMLSYIFLAPPIPNSPRPGYLSKLT